MLSDRLTGMTCEISSNKQFNSTRPVGNNKKKPGTYSKQSGRSHARDNNIRYETAIVQQLRDRRAKLSGVICTPFPLLVSTFLSLDLFASSVYVVVHSACLVYVLDT